MSIESKFAKKLRKLRKEYGFTQEGLAEIAGVEYKYIQMLEGKTPPSPTLRMLEKISSAFALEPKDLIDFDDL